MTRNILVLSAMLVLMIMPSFVATANAQFGLPNYGGQSYGVSRFVWEGVVDGTTFVKVQRNRAVAQNVRGLPVQQQRFDFSDPLPRTAVNLDLVVLDGRGRIRLVETPRQSNDYTAVVRIDDTSGGRDTYRFELRWNDRTRDDNYRNPVSNDTVVWSGQVDGEVIIHFRQNNAWIEKLSGQGAWGGRYRFSNPLSQGVQAVNLINTRGRGEVTIVEQPSRRNNYTASVLVRDRHSGASAYSFALNWERPRYRNFDNNDRGDRDRDFDRDRDRDRDRNRDLREVNGRRGLVWAGRVDGRDILYVRGNRVWFEHQAGSPILEDNANFFDALPRTASQVTVHKLRGRGNVQLLEAPSAHNDYTAKILVDDRDNGDDQYELEVIWQ